MDKLSSLKNFGFLIKIFYYYDIIGRIKYSNHIVDKKTDIQDINYINEAKYLDQYVSRLKDYIKEKILKKYNNPKKIRIEISCFSSNNKFHNLFWDVYEILKVNEKIPCEIIKENCIHILIFENDSNNLVFGTTILIPNKTIKDYEYN